VVCTLLEQLLPAGVASAELVGEGDPALLLAAERRLLRGAAPQRAREFAAGRVCARRAAAQFGVVDFPITAHDDHRPRWPQRLTGSITHTAGFAAAVVGERQRFRAIGIDAERISLMFNNVWAHVLLPPEIDWLEGLPVSEQAKAAALMFSAKEAFYKCQYEVTEQWLEFKDVTLEPVGRGLDRGSFAVRPAGNVALFALAGGPAIVHFAFMNDLVVTAMTIAAH
jgi:4'-phosphopantetheinyl transferase EntD